MIQKRPLEDSKLYAKEQNGNYHHLQMQLLKLTVYMRVLIFLVKLQELDLKKLIQTYSDVV